MTAPSPRLVALLANVGNRDVLRDGKPLGRPRPEGQHILEVWDDEVDRLDLALLRPTLAYLRRAGVTLDRIVLFATDQPPTVVPSHYDSDTLHCAEIARRLVEQIEAPTEQGKRAIYRGKVVVRLMRERNPSIYDETFPFYQSELQVAKVGGQIERCFVLASGGTPAMNLGLLVATIEKFGERCVPLYLQEGASEPRRLNLGQQLRQQTLRQVAASHVERYQFAAAADALAAADLDRTARELATYAAARLNFDWEGAWQVADAELPRAALGDRRLLERLRDEARRLSDRTDPALFLGERFHRARVAYEGHAYSEFLTLLVALEEAALREIARRELGIDADEDTPKARERRRRQVAERPDLQRFLEATMVDGQPLDYTRANRAALLAYLEYLARPGALAPTGEAGPPRADLAEVYRLVTRVDRGPAAARNRSVHRDGGASRAQIEALYNPPDQERRDLIDDLRTLTCRAGGRVDDWALDQIRETLLARLRP